MTEVLSHTSDDPGIQEGMQIILTAGRNLMHLLNDILETSRLDLGHAPDKESDIDLQQMFKELKELFPPLMKNKKYNFYCNPAFL